MFAELSDGGFFAYFAHSFALHQPAPSAVALTSCPASFVSAVRSGNIWGVQFHPEKSGADGHRLLASFVALADESKSGGGAA